MRSRNETYPLIPSQKRKSSDESPFEISTDLGKHPDVDWRDLMAKIYENINGPILKKKKSSKLIFDEQSHLSEDSISLKCNCKKTKCLKLYCECFAKGQYCNGCNCETCNNSSQFDQIRSALIDEIIQKNPNAFDASQRSKNTGCICKKTGCQKKYCECYNLGKRCGEQCKCANCLNVQ